MSGIFISHAFADKKYVDEFVEKVVKLGCEVPTRDIFYSSGDDTGIPSGYDLNHFVREQVKDAELVIALITPTYQTRPICIAELGASWSRVDNLFPILAPGMERAALEGVLTTVLIKYADDASALNELKDRIEAIGYKSRNTTWGAQSRRWIASASRLAKLLPKPGIISPDEADALRKELEETKEALAAAEAENEELKEENEALAAAKDPAAVKRIRRPKDDIKSFEALIKEARTALAQVPDIVAETIWHELSGNDMYVPDRFSDPTAAEAADRALLDKLLREHDGQLYSNEAFPKVRKASEALEEVQELLRSPSERFEEWFEEEYELPVDFTSHLVWEKLF